MNGKLSIAAAFAVLGGLATSMAGEIKGKVSFKGDEPPAIQIPFDPQCARMHEGKAKDEMPVVDFYIVGPEKGLADVFVYVKEGVPDKDYPVPEKPFELTQKGCIYKPYVFGLQVGQQLKVTTQDPVLHNVNVPQLKFNQAQLPNGPAFDFTFDEPKRFLNFECNVHPWMHAYANVVPHPFFKVTEKEGTFEFKDLPAGDYVVEAHHRKLGKVSKKVTIGSDDASASVDFTLELKDEEGSSN